MDNHFNVSELEACEARINSVATELTDSALHFNAIGFNIHAEFLTLQAHRIRVQLKELEVLRHAYITGINNLKGKHT